MRKPCKEIHLQSYDELFGLEPEVDRIIMVPLKDLHEFRNHPFRVKDDEKMKETVESIRQYGVLIPGIVRPRTEGGYELISGHRRKRGSELAGKTEMPVIVRNYGFLLFLISYRSGNSTTSEMLQFSKLQISCKVFNVTLLFLCKVSKVPVLK